MFEYINEININITQYRYIFIIETLFLLTNDIFEVTNHYKRGKHSERTTYICNEEQIDCTNMYRYTMSRLRCS